MALRGSRQSGGQSGEAVDLSCFTVIRLDFLDFSPNSAGRTTHDLRIGRSDNETTESHFEVNPLEGSGFNPSKMIMIRCFQGASPSWQTLLQIPSY